MRITLDTNILVSALIAATSPPDRIYEAWHVKRLFDLVTSKDQIDELKRVFQYEKLKPFIKPQEALDLVENIDTRAIIVSLKDVVKYSRDPADNRILSTAIMGRSDFIVTGDKRDLLNLKKVHDIPIFNAVTICKKIKV